MPASLGSPSELTSLRSPAGLKSSAFAALSLLGRGFRDEWKRSGTIITTPTKLALAQ
jgi:hypothetical protein